MFRDLKRSHGLRQAVFATSSRLVLSSVAMTMMRSRSLGSDPREVVEGRKVISLFKREGYIVFGGPKSSHQLKRLIGYNS